MKLEDGNFIRDYRIPLRNQKIAVLRIQHPIDEHDMNQLRKFLGFLEITVPDSKEAQGG